MGTLYTPGGLPYPDGTDLISNGDNLIGGLATAVDPSGCTLITPPAGGINVPNSAWTTITFATHAETGDTTHAVDRITVAKLGYYVYAASLEFGSSSATVSARCVINGAEYLLITGSCASVAGARPAVSIAGVLHLNAGAYVGLKGFQNAGATKQVTNASMSLFRIATEKV